VVSCCRLTFHLTPLPCPCAASSPCSSTPAAAAAQPPPEVQQDKLEEAVAIRDLLALNSEELRSVVRALNGEYILPEAGGDLLRDGAGGCWAGRQALCMMLGWWLLCSSL
jgi:hypothetical protein